MEHIFCIYFDLQLKSGNATETCAAPEKAKDLVSKEDTTDSVVDGAPQAAREEGAVNPSTGSGDGFHPSKHEKCSEPKAVDVPEASMGNLTVKTEGI